MSDAPHHSDDSLSGGADEFVSLALSYLENRATPEQCARLGDHLAASPQARRAFNRLAAQLVSLQTRTAVTAPSKPRGATHPRKRTPGISLPESAPPVSAAGAPIYRKGHEPQPSRIRPHHFAFAAVAAALLAVCGLAIYLLAFNVDPTPDPVDPDQSGPPVATLIQTSGGGTLTTPHGYPAEGEDFGRGEYTLTSGGAEFMLTNAVNVKLRGSTRLMIRNDMRVSLNSGTATFRCPPNVTGFTVELPGETRVTDLGTEFAIRVDDAGTNTIYVIDGLVELTAGDGSVQQIAAGDAYSIDPIGNVAALTRGAIIESMGSIALAGGVYERMILDDQPVAYWPLASGDTLVIDLVSDDKADASGVRFDAEGPRDASAAAFDGSAFVDLGQRPDLLIDGPMTVEAWVWFDPKMQSHGRIVSFDSKLGGGWAIGYTPTADLKHKPGVVFTMLNVADYPFADARIEHRRWTHLVATLDAARKLTIYLDGRPVGTAANVARFNVPRDPRAFLGQQSAGVVPLVGRLAHVAVYDRALTKSQIQNRLTAQDEKNHPQPSRSKQ